MVHTLRPDQGRGPSLKRWPRRGVEPNAFRLINQWAAFLTTEATEEDNHSISHRCACFAPLRLGVFAFPSGSCANRSPPGNAIERVGRGRFIRPFSFRPVLGKSGLNAKSPGRKDARTRSRKGSGALEELEEDAEEREHGHSSALRVPHSLSAGRRAWRAAIRDGLW